MYSSVLFYFVCLFVCFHLLLWLKGKQNTYEVWFCFWMNLEDTLLILPSKTAASHTMCLYLPPLLSHMPPPTLELKHRHKQRLFSSWSTSSYTLLETSQSVQISSSKMSVTAFWEMLQFQPSMKAEVGKGENWKWVVLHNAYNVHKLIRWSEHLDVRNPVIALTFWESGDNAAIIWF